MAQKINSFNTSDARYAALVDFNNDYTAQQTAINPAFVPLTIEQYLDNVLFESYKDQAKARKDQRRAERLASANSTKAAQIDAILDAP